MSFPEFLMPFPVSKVASRLQCFSNIEFGTVHFFPPTDWSIQILGAAAVYKAMMVASFCLVLFTLMPHAGNKALGNKAIYLSFSGLGFECGLYVKDLKHGFISEDQNNLKVGDYVMKVRNQI